MASGRRNCFEQRRSRWDITGATLTLLDLKGRNRHSNPRRHVLPIHVDLLRVIRRRIDQTAGLDSPLFSTAGRVPLRKETLATLVDEIEKAMDAAECGCRLQPAAKGGDRPIGHP